MSQKVLSHAPYLKSLVMLTLLIWSALTNANTVNIEEIHQQTSQQNRYQQLANLKTQMVILDYHDSKKQAKINQVIETFKRQYQNIFEYGEFSITDTKYYPVKNGKTLRPNLILGIGYSRRANHIFRELLRKAGLNARVLPASLLSSAKFEFELNFEFKLDDQNWHSL